MQKLTDKKLLKTVWQSKFKYSKAEIDLNEDNTWTILIHKV